MSEPQHETSGGSRVRKAALWSILTLAMLAVVVSVALSMATGRDYAAPAWLQERITTAINADIDGVSIGFGGIGLRIEEDWTPQLHLSDVTLRGADGAMLASLLDVRGTVALRPLMRGDLHPAQIGVSGARVILRRSADGRIGLSVGEAAPGPDEAMSVAELAARLDALLERPQFAALRQLSADNLTLRYEDARAERAWSADGGRLEMTRSGDDLTIRGDVALLGARDYATTLAMNYTRRIGETAADFGVTFEDMPARDIAGQSPALTWLEALDAPISGALRASVDEEGRLGPLNATLHITEGELRPNEATKPIPFSEARVYFTYDPADQAMRFSDVTLTSNWVTARAEGQAYLVGMEQGWPSELLGQFRLTDIRANPEGLYPEPVEIEQAVMDMRLRLDPFRLTLGQLSLSDQGSRMVLNGDLIAGAQGWRLALDGRMDALDSDRLQALWPRSVTPVTREWIEQNVRAADLSNLQLALRADPGRPADVFLGFDFTGLETQFVKDVPVIEAATGHASLSDNRFVITADSGHVTAAQGGRIDISGTSFIIPDVRVNRGPARARLSTQSTVTAALSLLNEKPFGFMTKANLPVTLADGQARLAGRLDFLLKPGLQPDEVAFDVVGTLSDVRSESLVQGRVIAAPVLDLKAGNSGVSVSGAGRIGQVPVEGSWQSALGPEADGTSRVSGWIELSERFVDEFRVGLPPGSLEGQGRADVEIVLPRGAPGQFTLRSDLAGVALRLPELDWALPAAARGSLEVSGTLGEPPQIDLVALDAGGLQAQGSVSLQADGTLERARFSRVRLDDWLSAPVDLVGRGADRAPQILVSGGTVDLRRTSLAGDGRGPDGGGPRRGGPVSLALDRLVISEGITLTDFRADLDMAGGATGRFTARVNEGAAITGSIVPKDGRSAFQIMAGDAGGVLASAGLLRQAREGEMSLTLVPAGAPGSYHGSLLVANVRLTDAPALADLLNAISVVGLLEQLDGEGIHFSEVKAQFELTPERVAVLAGSAVGASMGISMQGNYYTGSRQLDMHGVLSPFYMVNAVGGLFTRRGEGIVGVNYEMRGSADAPSVRVNPLSILTPGVFRDLFRRPPPDGIGAPQEAQDEGAPADRGQGVRRAPWENDR
ncbi:Protein of unknown function [Roseovarius litoreus]|uniref:AsmA-like C-terminal region n=1 Tax=Roseovarius litoreus TaxID=1155722 RepID=A0A1M7CWN4_9RHOB|nr:DUF3971 domain-containing protein [Roseovarius litoreus]SHL71610.1 Protein of unknown function [Roseovarius litoreus]